VESNDLATPQLRTALLGNGVGPAITLDPPGLDFGDPEVGCKQQQEIEIVNGGTQPLTIWDIELDATSDELIIIDAPSPGTLLGPGARESITVGYEPRDDAPDAGYLHVHSTDPWRPDAMAVQVGTAHWADAVVEEFEQTSNNKTDILWGVDNSCSMGNEQLSLAEGFWGLLGFYDVLDIDFHIAVVTTDNANFQGAIPIMTPATPELTTAFADAVSVGTNGSATEKGLQYAVEALTPPLHTPGGPNDGFLRNEAALRVIFVSDEEDQSSDTVVNYVAILTGLKPDPGRVVLGCVVVTPSLRYEQACNMTGGIVVDLTEPDWVDTLSQLAWLSSAQLDTFPLGQPAAEATIEVLLNGVPVYVGWYYDPVDNAVVFEPDRIPNQGDIITVRYHIQGSC